MFEILLVGLGHEALAIGLMVQREAALRPSELLALECQDVSLPRTEQTDRNV